MNPIAKHNISTGIGIFVACSISICVFYFFYGKEVTLTESLKRIDSKFKIVEILKRHGCPENVSETIATTIINELTKRGE